MPYHIHPETGEPGLCSAKIKCPFGPPDEHFETPQAARTAYELIMKLQEVPRFNRANEPRVVLETIHGSHLYGLSHADSDLDTYRVVIKDPYADSLGKSSLRTRQDKKGLDDRLETNLSAFLAKCDEGVPQALEAMFSRMAPPSSFDPFRRNYYVNTPRFAVTYRRTVMNFARLGVEDERAMAMLAPTELEEVKKKRVKESARLGQKPRRVERNGLLKYRRHSLRLLLNREVGIELGRFNPTLSEKEKDFVLRSADLEDMKFATLVNSAVRF